MVFCFYFNIFLVRNLTDEFDNDNNNNNDIREFVIWFLEFVFLIVFLFFFCHFFYKKSLSYVIHIVDFVKERLCICKFK